MQSNPRKAAQRGMTLVEVLVALAILGAVAGAVLTMIGQNARFIASSEDRLLASMLLDNELTEALAVRAALERGDSEKAEAFAGADWRVRRTVTEVGVESVVRINIDILRSNSDQIVASASTLKKEAE